MRLKCEDLEIMESKFYNFFLKIRKFDFKSKVQIGGEELLRYRTTLTLPAGNFPAAHEKLI